MKMPSWGVTCSIDKVELITAIRDWTIENKFFNSREWSLYDAHILKLAAEMIEREVTLEAAKQGVNLKCQP